MVCDEECRAYAFERVMIVGTGIDIQVVSTIAESIQKPAFLKKVFTPQEIALCQRQARRTAEHFAGKYAVKEAYMKALGAGIHQGVWFTQIEVLNLESGAPCVIPMGKAAELTQQLHVITTHVSISHSGDIAVGLVILEK